MSIKIAKTAGFCYGVKRAVDKTYEAIENSDKKIATLGHLIHNREVCEDLEKRGVFAYSDLSDIPLDATVVIRAHGVKKSIIEALEGRDYIDLTCPFVSNITPECLYT